MKFTKKEIKNRIRIWEYCRNGLKHLAGTGVKVVNLRLRRTKATADVILFTDLESGISERYNSCEYPFSELVKVKV